MRRPLTIVVLLFVAFMVSPELSWADRIGDIVETSVLDQAKRFFSFNSIDLWVRWVIL